MQSYKAENIRNIVLVGHGDEGKTSLAEQMLYLAGATDRLGNVAAGNTVMDYDAEEQKRGMSISAAVASLEWKGMKYNLIDVPGYFDFMGEMCGPMRVAKTAMIVLNGVSGLHGDILKRDLFRDLNSIEPDKFTFVTNGVDHRRWLAQVNPGLHGLICDLVGDKYLTDAEELQGLKKFVDDKTVLKRLEEIKYENKVRFAKFAQRNQPDFLMDCDAVMNVQVKRLHEYKRQLLCAMRIINDRNFIHANPNAPFVPRTYVFGAKAAAGYRVAKRIIELLCSLSKDINNDPLCKGKLQVFFLENYRVSAAERLMPAAQISEQISTAGKEASGTGNMKLMMNGALTIGTLDGANVEMYERLGDDNMFLFGLKTPEVEALRGHYNPLDYYNRSARLKSVIHHMNIGFSDGKSYSDLANALLYGGDQYMLMADFENYVDVADNMYDVMADTTLRAQKSLVNIAESGIFAADRSIRDYANNIWYL